MQTLTFTLKYPRPRSDLCKTKRWSMLKKRDCQVKKLLQLEPVKKGCNFHQPNQMGIFFFSSSFRACSGWSWSRSWKLQLQVQRVGDRLVKVWTRTWTYRLVAFPFFSLSLSFLHQSLSFWFHLALPLKGTLRQLATPLGNVRELSHSISVQCFIVTSSLFSLFSFIFCFIHICK